MVGVVGGSPSVEYGSPTTPKVQPSYLLYSNDVGTDRTYSK